VPQFRIPADIETGELPALITPFLRIVIYNAFQNRIEQLQGRMRASPFAEIMLRQRHTLEFAIWDVVSFFCRYGRLPRMRRYEQPSSLDLRAYAFISLLTKVYGNVNSHAKAILTGRIQHAFNDENDLLSLEHEFVSIAHLMRFGCTVICHDMEETGGFDFIALRNGLEFEVECKMISNDKGRQIHQHDCLVLAECIEQSFDWPVFREKGGGVVIRLRIPARLTRDHKTLVAMAEDIVRAPLSDHGITRDSWEIDYIPFKIAGTPFDAGIAPDLQQEKSFVRSLTRIQNDRLLIHAQQGQAAFIVSIQSMRPERTVAETYRTLKEGAMQFSCMRPALLLVAFQDLPAADLEYLAQNVKNNGFQGISTRLFKNMARQHLYGVNYIGDITYKVLPNGVLGSTGIVYKFINNANPYKNDDRLRLDLR